MDGLLTISTQLKQSGDKLLSESGLLETISKYGEVHKVGSHYLDVMFDNCDIDFYLVNSETTKELAIELLNKLMWQNYFHGYLFYDWATRIDRPTNFPPSYYIGMKFKNHEGRNWKIDIWLHNEDQINDKTSLYKSLITPENIEIILRIKNYRKHNSNKNNIFSIHIYDAVLLNNISSIEEFIEYHNKIVK